MLKCLGTLQMARVITILILGTLPMARWPWSFPRESRGSQIQATVSRYASYPKKMYHRCIFNAFDILDPSSLNTDLRIFGCISWFIALHNYSKKKGNVFNVALIFFLDLLYIDRRSYWDFIWWIHSDLQQYNSCKLTWMHQSPRFMCSSLIHYHCKAMYLSVDFLRYIMHMDKFAFTYAYAVILVLIQNPTRVQDFTFFFKLWIKWC